jgi:hypothetical protein
MMKWRPPVFLPERGQPKSSYLKKKFASSKVIIFLAGRMLGKNVEDRAVGNVANTLIQLYEFACKPMYRLSVEIAQSLHMVGISWNTCR